jgi:hypothetical protein
VDLNGNRFVVGRGRGYSREAGRPRLQQAAHAGVPQLAQQAAQADGEHSRRGASWRAPRQQRAPQTTSRRGAHRAGRLRATRHMLAPQGARVRGCDAVLNRSSGV